jgi:hypothetical protein
MTMNGQAKRPVTQGWTLRNYKGKRIVTPAGLSAGSAEGDLPNTGFAAFLRLKVVVKFDIGAGSTYHLGNAVDGIYDLIPNIKVTNNSGLTVFDASAATAFEMSKKRRYNYDTEQLPGSRIPGVIVNGDDTKSVALSNTNNVIVFYIDVPFTPNLGRNALYGITPVQSATSKWTAKLQFNDLRTVIKRDNGAVSDLANVSSYVDMSFYYFDIPASGDFILPPIMYQYTFTERKLSANMNTGRYQYELAPLDGTIVQAQMQFVSGASPDVYKGYESRVSDFDTQTTSAVVKDLSMWLNNTDLHTEMRADEHDARERELYGRNFGNGVYTFVDGLTVLDEPGGFLSPDYMFGFLDPSKFASARLEAELDNNGHVPAYTKLALHYFTEIAFK